LLAVSRFTFTQQTICFEVIQKVAWNWVHCLQEKMSSKACANIRDNPDKIPIESKSIHFGSHENLEILSVQISVVHINLHIQFWDLTFVINHSEVFIRTLSFFSWWKKPGFRLPNQKHCVWWCKHYRNHASCYFMTLLIQGWYYCYCCGGVRRSQLNCSC
jgi:hypothetical protein